MDDLEGAPNHAALRTGHAANDHTRIGLGLLRDKHARLCGASGVGADHGAGKTGSARVTQLLDGTPGAEAGVACFAVGAVRVIAGVLVKRDGAREVRSTDYVAAAAAVVFAEVPSESGLAESTCFGRLIGL